MNNNFNIGDTLYHKSNSTKCTITEISSTSLKLECEVPIANKSTLEMPLHTIGEFLFFSIDDVSKSFEDLISNELYLHFENSKIYEYYSNKIKSEELSENTLSKLLEKLSSHKFTGFHHYTDFSNFISIYNSQTLYSRNLSKSTNLIMYDSADRAVINQTKEFIKNYVRFYFRGKTPTLYKCEGVKENLSTLEAHMPNPVLLLFKQEILNHPNVKFSNINAGISKAKIVSNLEEVLTFKWYYIFHNQPFSPEEHFIIEYRHAELLYLNSISLKYLKGIIFRCEADRKNAISLFGNNDLFSVSPNSFSDNTDNRFNYLTDYNIDISGLNLKINLFFNNATIHNFSHVFKILYSNGESDTFEYESFSLVNHTGFSFETKLIHNCNFEIAYYLNNHRCIYHSEDPYDNIF